MGRRWDIFLRARVIRRMFTLFDDPDETKLFNLYTNANGAERVSDLTKLEGSIAKDGNPDRWDLVLECAVGDTGGRVERSLAKATSFLAQAAEDLGLGNHIDDQEASAARHDLIRRLRRAGLSVCHTRSKSRPHIEYIKIAADVALLKRVAESLDVHLLFAFTQRSFSQGLGNRMPRPLPPSSSPSSFSSAAPSPRPQVPARYGSGDGAVAGESTGGGAVRGDEDNDDDRIVHSSYFEFSEALMNHPEAHVVVQNTRCLMRSSIRLCILQAVISSPVEQHGCGVDLPQLVEDGVITQVVPLHEREFDGGASCEGGRSPLACLRRRWAAPWLQLPWKQPITAIQEYFGSTVALYYAFTAHFIKWLCYLSIAALVASVADLGTPRGSRLRHWVSIAYSIFQCVWAFLLLKFWGRREHDLATRWGTRGVTEREPPRPKFHGERRHVDLKNNKFSVPIYVDSDGAELYFSHNRRQIRQKFVSFPIILTLLAAVTAASIQILTLPKEFEGAHSDDAVSNTLASVIGTVLVLLFDAAYSTVAHALNDYENHRTASDHDNALILKTILFQAVNNYAPMIYIAFVPLKRSDFVAEHPEDDHEESDTSWQVALLQTQLLSRLIIKPLGPLLLWPLLHRIQADRSKARCEKSPAAKQGKVAHRTFTDKQCLTPAFTPLFDEYASLAIQFGYVCLFGPLYPLGVLATLLLTAVDLRFTAQHLTSGTQRPYPKAADSIGAWLSFLRLLVYASIATNMLIITELTKSVERVRWGVEGMGAFALLQNSLLAVMGYLLLVIPDVPYTVLQHRAKDAYLRDSFTDIGGADTDDEMPPAGAADQDVLQENMSSSDDDSDDEPIAPQGGGSDVEGIRGSEASAGLEQLFPVGSSISGRASPPGADGGPVVGLQREAAATPQGRLAPMLPGAIS